MRNIGNKLVIIFFILISYTSANSIDEQIKAIQNAPVKERFKLMNQFKKNLIQMQENKRIEAVKKLSKNANNKKSKKLLKELEENTKRIKMQKHIEHQQIAEDNINNDIDFSEGGYDND